MVQAGSHILTHSFQLPYSQDAYATLLMPQSCAATLDTFVHNLDSSRYQLLEKKEEKEVYLDKMTGTKWVLKIEKKD